MLLQYLYILSELGTCSSDVLSHVLSAVTAIVPVVVTVPQPPVRVTVYVRAAPAYGRGAADCHHICCP